MTEEREDYFYEIQLTNKQLVFYFLAGAVGLILSFLAGVMVGRGVDQGAGEAQAARPVQDERVVPDESPSARPSPPAAEELTYAQRLESDKADDSLIRPTPPPPTLASTPSPGPSPSAAKSSKAAPSSPGGAAKGTIRAPGEGAAAPKPAAKGGKPASKAISGTFSIQVGAFKDKEAADSVVARLKKKGYAAQAVAPDGAEGLYNVRVGSYAARADAEHALARLRDEEKFKPFIVKN